MNEDPYKAPESNVEVASRAGTALPNPFLVALMMIGVSLVISVIIGIIEYFLGITFPANTFLTTIIPAFIVGSYYGKKRQNIFPRNFKIKVVVIWLVMGIVLAGLAFGFIAPDLISSMLVSPAFVGIFIGAVLLGCLFCYLALSFGEKIAIKALQKKTL